MGKRDFWDKLKYGAEMVGLVVLAVYAWYTIKMYSANKLAADAAKRGGDAEVAANRAWIVADFPPQHKRVIEEANLEWRNTGETPAIGVFNWREHFTGEFPKTMRTCSEVEKEVEAQSRSTREYQAFVAEGGRYEVGLDHVPPWAGQQPISIHGCVWYTDILSNTKKSSEFFYIAFQGKYSLPTSEGISLFFDRPVTYE